MALARATAYACAINFFSTPTLGKIPAFFRADVKQSRSFISVQPKGLISRHLIPQLPLLRDRLEFERCDLACRCAREPPPHRFYRRNPARKSPANFFDLGSCSPSLT